MLVRKRSTICNIRIAVIGSENSQREALAGHLNGYTFTRREDAHRFCFTANPYAGVSKHLVEQYEVAIFAFALDHKMHENYIMARQIHRESLQLWNPQICCMVGVKTNFEPEPFSDLDLYMRQMKFLTPYKNGIPLFQATLETEVDLSAVTSYIANTMTSFVPRRTPGIRDLLRQAVSWLLDNVAATFALPVPKNVNQDTPDAMHIDDSVVSALERSSLAQAWDRKLIVYSQMPSMGVSAHRITNSLLSKAAPRCERVNMTFVRSHTSIPVPQPRYPGLSSRLVMDFVDGKMLLDCWDSLSLFMQFRIACTLRCYIKQLRRLSGSRPGTVDGGVVDGVLFEGEERGPFQTSRDFRIFCELVSHCGWEAVVGDYRRGLRSDIPSPPVEGDEWPLVFTHGDLHLSNLILSKDGVLWVIDWAHSGYYPVWMESVGLNFHFNNPRSWRRLTWLMAGTYPAYDHFWEMFLNAAHRFI